MKKRERYFQSLDLPKGKTIVITGGNSGIGFSVAQYCVKAGLRVILAVRNPQRGEDAKKKLLALDPAALVEVWLLDLASVESVHSFVQKVKESRLDIDVFYCNAGIYRVPFATLHRGIESQMWVNFAANLLLFQELEDYFHSLSHPVKFILTSSVVAHMCKLNEGDLFVLEKNYDKSMAYRKSKLAVNHLYTYLLTRTQGTNILPLLVHPGIVFTPLIAKAYPNPVVVMGKRFLRLFFNRPETSALCTMLLLQDHVDSPCLCGPKRFGHTRGYPKIYPLYSKNIHDVQKWIDATIEAMK